MPFVSVNPGDVALTVIPTPGVDCVAVPDPLNPMVWPVPVSIVVKTDEATAVVPSSALDLQKCSTFCREIVDGDAPSASWTYLSLTR